MKSRMTLHRRIAIANSQQTQKQLSQNQSKNQGAAEQNKGAVSFNPIHTLIVKN